MTSRPRIPFRIKQAVRQACGFGCVICGVPIYHYDHMRPYADNKEHTADNLCLLCARHHDEKTRGWLPLEQVLAAKASPVNKRAGTSGVQRLHYAGKACVVNLGSNIAVNDLAIMHGKYGAIVILNEELLTFRIEDDQLLLSILLKDRKGNILFHIDDNEMIFRADLWDVEFVGTKLTIRDGYGSVSTEIIFNAPSEIIVQKATFWNGDCSLDVSSVAAVGPRQHTIIGHRSYNVKYGIVINSREDFWPSSYRIS